VQGIPNGGTRPVWRERWLPRASFFREWPLAARQGPIVPAPGARPLASLTSFRGRGYHGFSEDSAVVSGECSSDWTCAESRPSQYPASPDRFFHQHRRDGRRAGLRSADLPVGPRRAERGRVSRERQRDLPRPPEGDLFGPGVDGRRDPGTPRPRASKRDPGHCRGLPVETGRNEIRGGGAVADRIGRLGRRLVFGDVLVSPRPGRPGRGPGRSPLHRPVGGHGRQILPGGERPSGKPSGPRGGSTSASRA